MLERLEDITTAMRRHSVEPSVFVVTIDEHEHPNVMACGWNVKCSYEPPLLGIALSKKGYSHKLVEARKQFVIAVPTPELEDELLYAGSVSGADTDKLAESGIHTQPAHEIDAPLLTDARANYECTLEESFETGDHIFYVGRIVAAHYDTEKEQLFFAGRNPDNSKRFESVETTFPGE